jgi:hypothetical protein
MHRAWVEVIMLLFLFACAPEYALQGPPTPVSLEHWLTAFPDELHPEGTPVRWVYEDVVELPDDTLSATLVARTSIHGDPCDASVRLGAAGWQMGSESERDWVGQTAFNARHELYPGLLHDELELYVVFDAPPGECPEAPSFVVDGLDLHITRGARR